MGCRVRAERNSTSHKELSGCPGSASKGKALATEEQGWSQYERLRKDITSGDVAATLSEDTSAWHSLDACPMVIGAVGLVMLPTKSVMCVSPQGTSDRAQTRAGGGQLYRANRRCGMGGTG